MCCFALLFSFTGTALPAQASRIAEQINSRERVTLAGQVHPKVAAGTDQGAADASLVLPYVTIMFQPSATQQTDLDQLLQDQQNPSSPHYHQWLTPEQYADRFGVSPDDLSKVTAWLESQGLKVTGVSRARAWVAFSGTAAQVQSALDTEIHRYTVDGETHFANSADPTIPAALQGVVRSIRGLNDFRLKPVRHAAVRKLGPNYTSSKGNHYLAPADVAVIYNTQPLYNNGITGAGQKIAVVGQTQVQASDITQFRSYFGLPTNDPQLTLVPGAKDPGIQSDDMVEADLDLEWSGAMAPNASVQYVYSDDVMTSAQYAVDQNLAPVLSISYGSCEPLNATSDVAWLRALAQQASAQGISWFAASGDDGGADCYGESSRQTGASVDLPASLPEVTGVGGTTLVEGSGSYWNTSNDASHASVLSYIPETTWNDSAADGTPSASGGGASIYFTQPTWQTGTGVPANNARNVPDVSLSASADHDGYLIYNAGSLGVVGGTSVGSPSFAGIAALLNHYLVTNGFQASAGLGNLNPRLYSLAQANPQAFHDITTGDNKVSACSGTRGCSNTSVGYSAGTGYDQATGLGSVDAYQLVTSWHVTGSVSRATASMAVTANQSSYTTLDTAVITATVTGSNGSTPTGTVAFSTGSSVLGTATLVSGNGAGVATLSVNAGQLAIGTTTITAQYSGDTGYSPTSGSVVVSIQAVSSGTPQITALANAASYKQAFAPGMIVSVFGSNLAPATQSAASVPLPTQLDGVSVTVNGVAAPLYYVSPGQLNVQIPYETAAGATAVLTVNNNGQTASTSFLMATAAPGIFVDANGAPVGNATAQAGQVVTLYVTGAGTLSPTVATGAAPSASTAVANLPKPMQSAAVTVGGTAAAIQFIGDPAGLVGVVQINYQVPAGATAGSRAVVVTVGGVVSAAATLVITP